MKQLEKARKYEELYKELFDRNSKVTTICLLLCGAFWVLKLYVLSEQCLILFFFSGGLYGVRRIHREDVQLGEYYLPDQLRTSSICNKVLSGYWYAVWGRRRFYYGLNVSLAKILKALRHL